MCVSKVQWMYTPLKRLSVYYENGFKELFKRLLHTHKVTQFQIGK